MELTLFKLIGEEPTPAHPAGSPAGPAAGLIAGQVDLQDYLSRADTLAATGCTTIVSDYFEYYRLGAFLRRMTDRPLALALGVPSLNDIFQERYYQALEGGILEAMGRLFKYDVRIYVYPQLTAEGQLLTAHDWQPPRHLLHLYQHLLETRRIIPLEGYQPECLSIFSRDILAKIRRGEPGWEIGVPPEVAEIIHTRQLFRAHPTPGHSTLTPG
jgi:hypothetical protein